MRGKLTNGMKLYCFSGPQPRILFMNRLLKKLKIAFVTVAGKGFYDRPEIRDLLNILRAVADPLDNLSFAGLPRSPALV